MDPMMPPGPPMTPNFNGGPLQPLMPGLNYPMSNKMVRGFGKLTWLSPKAGLITCHKMNGVTVSFQLKDFVDNGVTDFTTVLRPGFRLAFQAVADEGREWIANFVSPCNEPDPTEPEINLEEYEGKLDNRAPSKDPYSLDLETHAISMVLGIFQKAGTHTISLSNLHSRISNSGREDLYRYIGSSSLKRRQFIERRSYVFHITENDVVVLQPPEMYAAVLALSNFLLRHGGATSTEILFNTFMSAPEISQSIKESIQGTHYKQMFMDFLNRHSFAFAPFPQQQYVAVRRKLLSFPYEQFIRKNFTNFNRPSSVAFNAPQQPPTLPPFGGFDQNAAAAADKMAMNQYFNSPMNFGGMFSNDEGMNPRNPINPWANDNSIQSHVSTPPFGAQMDMPFGPGSNINKPAGVIGNGNMTRHNSMGSMGSNQYDMMRHNNDLRISCSPPISNLMGNVRPMVYNISTQTEQTIEQKPIAVDPACRCQCQCGSRQNGYRQSKAPSPLKSAPASRQSSNGHPGVIAPPNSSGSTSSYESGIGSLSDVLDPHKAPSFHLFSNIDAINSVTSLSNAVASTASIWGAPTSSNSQTPSLNNACFGFPSLMNLPPLNGSSNQSGQGNNYDFNKQMASLHM